MKSAPGPTSVPEQTNNDATDQDVSILVATCSFFYFFYRDLKKAEQMTVAWADEHRFPIPENIRRAMEGAPSGKNLFS